MKSANRWNGTIVAHKAAGMRYVVKPSMPTPKTLVNLKDYSDYYYKVSKNATLHV